MRGLAKKRHKYKPFSRESVEGTLLNTGTKSTIFVLFKNYLENDKQAVSIFYNQLSIIQMTQDQLKELKGRVEALGRYL